MRPTDPRLLRLAGPPVVAVVALGAASAALIIGQAFVLSATVAAAFAGRTGGLGRAVGILAALVAGRVAVAWLTETAALRASAAVKSALRVRLVAHALRLGPAWLTGQRSADLARLATRGVDALDDYFARYLPQLFLAVLVPLAVLGVVAPADPIAGITIAVTLPLIPVFMALIGLATAARTKRRWRAENRLGHHFLDVVAGLPTLKVFGRSRAQAERIATVTDSYRRATMGTLRLAFLSSAVLELLATISVALVAVGIGLRLVDGHVTLQTALLVLLLAPEAYAPLRAVGAQFHASADGLEAAEKAFTVLQTPPPAAGTTAPPASVALRVRSLTVHHPGRDAPAPHGLSFTLSPGEFVAVTGASGAGKSTLLNVLLGFEPSDAVTVDGIALAELDPEAWRRRIAWVPQDPRLAPGPVSDLTGPTDFLDDVPGDQLVAERGQGLSAGQRRRVALARALGRDAPLLLLDEPTAGVDAAREAIILRELRRLADAGRAVLVVAHRPAVAAAADRVVAL